MLKLFSTFCILLWIQAVAAESATVATASNFKIAMTELIDVFQAKHPHQIRQINASSGLLYNQILQGAPFDVLLSANSLYPERLGKTNKAIEDSRFSYAQGRLVLAFKDARSSQQAEEERLFVNALKSTITENRKVAIANPAAAPYGIAARQSLEHLKLWKIIQPQLVRGSNVGQTFQFVATGNAAVGFAALSQVKNNPTLTDYWLIPNHWHKPIRQQAILLQSGKHNSAAHAFLGFLITPEARKIIHKHGYFTPDT